LKRYVESAHGGSRDVREQIAEASKETMKFKQKYQELRQGKKDAETQRNSYFTILADNQKLKNRMKKQRNSSLAPLPTGKPGRNVF